MSFIVAALPVPGWRNRARMAGMVWKSTSAAPLLRQS